MSVAMCKSIVLVIFITLLLVSCSSEDETKNRCDPNYTQEFLRVREKGFSSLMTLDGHIECEFVHKIVSALQKINCSSIDIVSKGNLVRGKNVVALDAQCYEQLPVLVNQISAPVHRDILITVSTSHIPVYPVTLGKHFSMHLFTNSDMRPLRLRKHALNRTSIRFQGYNAVAYYGTSKNKLQDSHVHDDENEASTKYNKYFADFILHEPEMPIFIDLSGTLDSTFSDHLSSVLIEGILTEPFSQFVKWNLPVLRQRKIRISKRESPNIALIVEPRAHAHLEFVVRNVLLHLNANETETPWMLQIHVSSSNHAFTKKIFEDLPEIEYKLLPDKFASGEDYNTLLKENDLWVDIASRGAKYVLVFQIDSILLGKNYAQFLQFDYIGAPWHVTPNMPSSEWIRNDYALSLVSSKSAYFKACCNGGLSLRNTAAMVEVTRSRRSRNPSVNEDTYFSRSAKDLNLKLPNRDEAYSFAWEIPCSDITSEIEYPFALHNAWVYLNLSQIWKFFYESMDSIGMQIIDKRGDKN